MGPAGSEDAWCTSEAWCVGATTTVVKPTTIDTMSTAAKSDMSSRVKSMRENTKETQDDTPLVVHNPVDDALGALGVQIAAASPGSLR